MLPAILKAKQAAAMADTASGLVVLDARLASIEASLELVLALLQAQAETAPPKTTRKDR
jgi:hypothetical protein